MMNIGFGEIFMILIIVLILFGAKRIPEIAKSIGKGILEFKKGLKEIENEVNIEEENNYKRDKEE